MTDLLCKDEVYAIIGAAMEVYNDLGQSTRADHSRIFILLTLSASDD
jgi:hypothetical protein